MLVRNTLIKSLLLALVCLMSVSCSKELIWGAMRNDGRIVPVVKSVNTKASSGGLDVEPVSSRVVAVSDSLELIKTVYDDPAFLQQAATKSKVKTTSSITGFTMKAYAEQQWHDNRIQSGPGSISDPNAPGLYFTTTVSGSSGGGWNMADEQTWLNGVPLSIWCSDDYPLTLNSPTSARFEMTVSGPASGHKDPVFSYNRETRSFYEDGDPRYGQQKSCQSTGGSSDESVNIRFFHALSAIQFFKGTISGSYKISNITIQGVDSHSVCNITADPSVSPEEGVSNLTFSHSSDTPASFSQDYEGNDPSLARPSAGKYDADDSKTFFMIPQDLGSDAALKVTFTDNKGHVTSSVFSLDGDSWETGKYYVYRIGLTGAVRISIEETCNSATKSNVRFRNDSNVSEYIRAAVVGNWMDDGGNVVAAWDKGRDGSFSPGSGWSESGGFYYYSDAVAAGKKTEALISSFTKPVAAPVAGAHFEMTILVQAVQADNAADCMSAF